MIEKVLTDMAVQQKVYQHIMQRNHIAITHRVEKALSAVNVADYFSQEHVEICDTAVQIPEPGIKW